MPPARAWLNKQTKTSILHAWEVLLRLLLHSQQAKKNQGSTDKYPI